MSRKQNSNPKPFAAMDFREQVKAFSFRRLAILLLGVCPLVGIVWLLFKCFPNDFPPIGGRIFLMLFGCYCFYCAFSAIKTGSVHYKGQTFKLNQQPVRFFALFLSTVLAGIFAICLACIV